MKKQRLDYEQYVGLVNNVCREIANSGWRPDYVVGITRGGLLPAVMISQYFNIPCETLKVSLRDEGDSESNLWMAEQAFGYVPKENRGESGTQVDPAYRKNILIVDDINDSGATLNWIMHDWPSGCLPDHDAWRTVWGKNVRVAVVVDNLSSECNLPIAYSGMTIDKSREDVWVEFPYESWWSK